MSAETRIIEELSGLEYTPKMLEINGLGGRRAVTFNYSVKAGRLKGNVYKVGIAFQESGYPEYPPHFVWVAELGDPRLPVHSTRDHQGVRWSVFSVPPSDFWDRLPSSKKNMETYLRRHFIRFWSQV